MGRSNLGIAGDAGTTLLKSGSNLQISGSATLGLATPHTMTLNGTTTWTGGVLHVSGGAALVMNNGGTFNDDANGVFEVGAGASATFNNPGTFTKGSNADVTTFAPGFHNTGTVNVNAGTLVLLGGDGGAGAGGVFNVTGSTLDLRGGTFSTLKANVDSSSTLIASGAAATLAGGSVVAGSQSVRSGSLTVPSGLTISPSSITLSGGKLGGGGSISGNLTWTGGTLGGGGGQLSGTLTMNGSGEKDFAAPYTTNLSGSSYWSAGRLRVLNPAKGGFQTLTINNTGTFNAYTNDSFDVDCCFALALFNNSGTFNRSGSSSSDQVLWSPALHNTGTVTVSSATLTLRGGDGAALAGSPDTGSYNVSNTGAVAEFRGGGFGAVKPTGSGLLLVSGANVVVGANGSPAYTGGLHVAAGTLKVNATVGGVGTLTLDSGSFGGSGTLTVSTFDWNGGQLGDGGGTLSSGGGTIQTAAEKQLQAPYTWNNTGSSNWFAGNLHGLAPSSGGKFVINNSSFFDIWGANQFLVEAASSPYLVFVNTSGGTLYTSGVDGQILWQAPLFNQGSVEDGGGINSNDTLTLSGGDGQSLLPTTYQGGTYKPDNSRAVIELQSGTFSSNQVGGGSAFSAGSLLVSGASVSLFGSGTVLHLNFDVKAGSLSWSNSASLDKLTLEGGSFGGSGTLTVSTFDWNGGQLGDGGGSLATSAATIAGSGTHDVLGPFTWTANGTTTWNGGTLNAKAPTTAANGNDFLLDNEGTFNIRADSDFTAQATIAGQPQMFFKNAGTLDKTDTGTAGKTAIEVPLFNSGTVSLTDAILTLAGGDGRDHFGSTPGGTFTIASDATLEIAKGDFAPGTLTNGGTLAVSGGTLTVGAHSNSAKIRLSGGTLNVQSYTQSATGELDVILSGTTAGTGFGPLKSVGAVSLGGTFNVSNATGYTPATGSTYLIITGSAVSGTFSTTTLNGYTLTMGAATVRLTK
ncbi:MAG: hypothetical protein E6I85_09875 [Chloroflexi bacterium]|nr:MAG: hypothetical protein E6I85_09875 [Chloroflexota bacterium]